MIFHGSNSAPIFTFPVLNRHPGTNLAETCPPETCYPWEDFYEPAKINGKFINWNLETLIAYSALHDILWASSWTPLRSKILVPGEPHWSGAQDRAPFVADSHVYGGQTTQFPPILRPFFATKMEISPKN